MTHSVTYCCVGGRGGQGGGGRNRRGPHTPSISTGRNKALARRPRRAYFYRVFATQSPKNKDKKGPPYPPQAPTQQMTHSVTYCCVGGRVAGGGGRNRRGPQTPSFFKKKRGGGGRGRGPPPLFKGGGAGGGGEKMTSRASW